MTKQGLGAVVGSPICLIGVHMLKGKERLLLNLFLFLQKVCMASKMV